MEPTKISQVAEILEKKASGPDAKIQSVSIDSRTITPGGLFIAIVGPNFDGHDFIEQAKQNGASAALVSRPVETSLPTIEVADTRLASLTKANSVVIGH